MSEPDWVRVQRKAFTRWCNSHLVQVGIVIENLENDLVSGYSLHQLVELLSQRKLGKPVKNPSSDFQKVQNLNIALDCLTKQEHVKLVNIGAEDIMQKNTKLDLGLIWSLILKYQISGFEDEESGGQKTTPKRSLLDWVNRVLNPQGIIVKDFTNDWKDGAGFSGLVNVLEPETFDLQKLNRDDDDEKIKNLEKAFEEAEKLGIARLLDSEDVLQTPDELAVMSYVSLFRKKLQDNSPYAPNCYAEGPGLTNGIAKKKSQFRVITINEDKEEIKRGGANIVGKLVLRGPADSKQHKCVVKDNMDGTYGAYYEAPIPGTYELDVLVNGVSIKGSPFHPVVVQGGPDAEHCIAYGPGLESVVAGKDNDFIIKASDDHGEPLKEGGAKFIAVFEDVDGNKTNVLIDDQKNGLYEARYNPVKAGNGKVLVDLANEEGERTPIKDSPFPVVVAPGKIDPSASQVEFTLDPDNPNSIIDAEHPGVVVAGTLATFKVFNKDSNGNLISDPNQEVSSRLVGKDEGLEEVPVSVTNNQDGTFAGEFTPFIVGNYGLGVSCNGQPVPKSPFPIKVIPAEVDKDTTIVDAPGLYHRDANGNLVDAYGNPVNEEDVPVGKAGEQLKARFQARDKFGNLITHGGDNFTATLIDPDGNEIPVQVVDNGDGTYDVVFNPVKAGKYMLHVKLDGEEVKDSPFEIIVAPGESVPEEAERICPVSRDVSEEVGPDGKPVRKKDRRGNGDDIVVAGEEGHFGIQAKDSQGNKAEVGGHVPYSKLTGPEEVQTEIADLGNGVYEGKFVPTKIGKYELDLRLDDKPIKGSPFPIEVIPADAYPQNTIAEGGGLHSTVSGHPNEFVVKPHDRFDNPVDFGGDDIKVEIVPATSEGIPNGDLEGHQEEPIKGEVVDPDTGVYDVRYPGITKAGPYRVDVTLNGEPIRDSPFTLVVKPDNEHPDPSKSYLLDLKPEQVAGDEQKPLLVTADKNGNPLDEGGKNVEVKLVDPDGNEVPVSVVDNGDGTYGLEFAPTKAGVYKATPTINGEPIKDAPFDVLVKPDNEHPDPSRSYLRDLQPEQVAGDEQRPTLVTADKYGNPLDEGGKNVEVRLVDPDGNEVPVGVVDNGDGTYGLEFAPTRAGVYKATPTINGEPIKDAPFDVLVKPDNSPENIPPEECYLIELAPEQVAGEQQKPVIRTIDKHGNPLTQGGAQVGATLVDPDGNPIPLDIKDNGDGTYTVDYTPTKAGPTKGNASINGKDIKGSPFEVSVVPSVVDPSHCVASGPGISKAKSAKPAKFKVSLFDRFDNPIKENPGSQSTGILKQQDVFKPQYHFGEDEEEDEEDRYIIEDRAVDESEVPVTVDDKKDGTFDAEYTLVLPGTYQLNVLVDNAPVRESPFAIKTTPGKAFPPRSKVVKPKRHVPGRPGPHVYMSDENGHPRHKGGQDVKAVLRPKNRRSVPAVDNGDGSFTLNYPPDVRGAYKVQVFAGDEPIPGGDYPADFDANPPLPEEQQKELAETLPESNATISRLLANATEDEIESFFNDLRNLKGSDQAHEEMNRKENKRADV